MKDFPTKLAKVTTTLISGEYGEKCNESLNVLSQKGFEVHLGISEEFTDQLIEMAKEDAIKEYCPNDSETRFTNLETINKWLKKEKAVFLLVENNGDELNLAGYGWVGKEKNNQVDKGDVTFALRVGTSYQGKGLATPFSSVVIYGSNAIYGAQNIWLATWSSNAGAVHVYKKIGFEIVSATSSKRKTLNGNEVEDTRLLMTIPNSKLQ